MVGRERVAVVDPGPDLASHVSALASVLEGAQVVAILLTHGHSDHAAAAPRLARMVSAPVLGGGPAESALGDGEAVETDAGELFAVATPGHAREHVCFHWTERRALFAGDLLLGKGDTTWVGGYSGCVRDYFASLERVRQLGLRRVYPAHGPPIADVPRALARFESHRRARLAEVEAFLAEHPEASRHEIMQRIYGSSVPRSLEAAAEASLDALLEHLGRSVPR